MIFVAQWSFPKVENSAYLGSTDRVKSTNLLVGGFDVFEPLTGYSVEVSRAFTEVRRACRSRREERLRGCLSKGFLTTEEPLRPTCGLLSGKTH